MDDCTLIRAIQRGDDSAWPLLYARHQPRLVGLFRSMSGPSFDIEDWCQQTWERVIRSFRQSYTPHASERYTDTLWPWLAVVARHTFLRAWQRGQRLQQCAFEDMPVEDFADTLLRRTFALQLVERLEYEHDREIMRLRVWEDLTYPEIALLLGIDLNTVRWRYEHALQELRVALGLIAPPVRKERGALILPPSKQREAARQYAAGGISRPALAALYGVSLATMNSYLRKQRAQP